VIFHQDAETELHAAVAYYQEQSHGLGADFQAQIERSVRRIQHAPQSFPQYNHQGIQSCLIRRFPYTVFYLELEDHIWIVAVAHQRRKPGYWARRTPR
jgi:toxin ParE1/3/4